MHLCCIITGHILIVIGEIGLNKLKAGAGGWMYHQAIQSKWMELCFMRTGKGCIDAVSPLSYILDSFVTYRCWYITKTYTCLCMPLSYPNIRIGTVMGYSSVWLVDRISTWLKNGLHTYTYCTLIRNKSIIIIISIIGISWHPGQCWYK